MIVQRERQSENTIALFRRRIHRNCTSEMVPRLLVSPRIQIVVAQRASDRDGSGIQFLRRMRNNERFVEPAARCEKKRVPLLRSRITGIELDRALELPLGIVPIPIIDEQ